MTRKSIAAVIIGIILIASTAAYLLWDRVERSFFSPNGSSLETGLTQEAVEQRSDIETVAENLSIPWGVAFLPDETILVTERTGTLKRVSDGRSFAIDGVRHIGEGGLLGLAAHPDFETNNYLYLYLTTESASGLVNRVERYRLTEDSLSDPTVIIDNILGARVHDGGRIAFGPDDLLYITTGDAGNPDLAQDITSLAGKILRLTDSGETPAGNPFGTAIYSYGHRNPQGLAWDDQERLWSTEHGPSGAQTGHDELNLIQPGGNYGWPLVRGDESRSGMIAPIAHSGSDETWAPAGLTHQDGSLFFGGLRGESLYEARIIGDDTVALTAHFRSEFGRIRTTITGPDGALYVTTSNTDGRGTPAGTDDRLIRLDNRLFR